MCKYCNDEYEETLCKKRISVLNENIGFEMYVSTGDSSLRVCSGENYIQPLLKKKIKFCPMCGRKLNE